MPWIYVPAQESAAQSGEASADERFAMWRTMLIASGSSKAESETGLSVMRRSGRTCGTSMGDRGGDSFISCSGASPASHGALPESGKATPTSAIYGRTSGGCFARWNPVSRSWKTSQVSLLPEEGWQGFSGSWPRSGMTRSGRCWRLETLVRRTGGRGSGLWPTPDASCGRPHEGNVRLLRAKVLAGELSEEEARGMLHGGKSPFEAQGKIPAMWPTPSTRDHHAQGAGMNTKARSPSLATTVQKLWLTPSARDWRSGKASQDTLEGNSRPLNEVVTAREQLPTPTAQRRTGLQSHGRNVIGGQLNPTWVEWLMGWPIGWTDCEASVTGGFRRWRSSLWVAWRNFSGQLPVKSEASR